MACTPGPCVCGERGPPGHWQWEASFWDGLWWRSLWTPGGQAKAGKHKPLQNYEVVTASLWRPL